MIDPHQQFPIVRHCQSLCPPASMRDLPPSERRIVSAMHQLGHGSFNGLRIANGEVVAPWPTCVRNVKFCSGSRIIEPKTDDFRLKKQVIEFLQFVRAVDVGEICRLTIIQGLPFSMEVVHDFGTLGVDLD